MKPGPQGLFRRLHCPDLPKTDYYRTTDKSDLNTEISFQDQDPSTAGSSSEGLRHCNSPFKNSSKATDSGLSITRWDLFSGILPPLTLNDWEKSFSLYKEIPEYNLLNYSMTLEQFKTIYWWEYIHRLLGRLIGLFYFIP